MTVPDLPYRCTHCGRIEHRPYVAPPAGGCDASARVAGWRIGTTAAGARDTVCPACAGTNPDHWDAATLAQARAAGIA